MARTSGLIRGTSTVLKIKLEIPLAVLVWYWHRHLHDASSAWWLQCPHWLAMVAAFMMHFFMPPSLPQVGHDFVKHSPEKISVTVRRHLPISS